MDMLEGIVRRVEEMDYCTAVMLEGTKGEAYKLDTAKFAAPRPGDNVCVFYESGSSLKEPVFFVNFSGLERSTSQV